MDEAWQRDCEQAADHHIRTCMEHERRHLANRLADAVPGQALERGEPQDPIRGAVAAVVASAAPYLEQEYFSDTTKAERLAEALQALDHQLLPSETCQAIDEAETLLQLRVEQIAQQHGPQIRRTLDQRQVLGLLEQEDDRMLQVLITLYQRLQAWVPFNDHDTSKRDGVLETHSQAECMLAAAVCDLLDALAADSISTSADDLAKRIQAEVANESAAHRSHAKLRLMRLLSCIQGWLDDAPDEHEQLGDVCTELLLLCQHLGITKAAEQPGGAT
jgi:hypothetical protein